MSVIWHDLECGTYAEDLPLWRSLAAEHGDPVLDVGAGTGRVALDLARSGYRVFPLVPDGKVPLIPKERGGHGCLDATTDLAQVEEWWNQYPHANIGIATGRLWHLAKLAANYGASAVRLFVAVSPVPDRSFRFCAPRSAVPG